MNWETAQTCINSSAAIVVLWSSVCALTHMGWKTRFDIRLAYILLGVGSVAVLLAPGYLGRTPAVSDMLLVYGAALLCLANRRRRKHAQKVTPLQA